MHSKTATTQVDATFVQSGTSGTYSIEDDPIFITHEFRGFIEPIRDELISGNITIKWRGPTERTKKQQSFKDKQRRKQKRVAR